MAQPPPVPSASSPVPPALLSLPLVSPRTGIPTVVGGSFLTQLWAAVAGSGGVGPTLAALQATVTALAASVASLATQVAIIFGMHGDGTLTAAGELIVTKTNGVPFAPSATTDTTNAANITSGTLATARIPVAVLQSSTIAGLPAAAAQSEIYCSNLGGGPGMLVGNGTQWMRTSPGLETQAPASTLTLTVLTNAEEQYQSTALSAGMTVTMAAAKAYKGARFRWIRAGAGAYTITFVDGGSSGTIYTSAMSATETVEFVYSGAAWVVAQHSTI